MTPLPENGKHKNEKHKKIDCDIKFTGLINGCRYKDLVYTKSFWTTEVFCLTPGHRVSYDAKKSGFNTARMLVTWFHTIKSNIYVVFISSKLNVLSALVTCCFVTTHSSLSNAHSPYFHAKHYNLSQNIFVLNMTKWVSLNAFFSLNASSTSFEWTKVFTLILKHCMNNVLKPKAQKCHKKWKHQQVLFLARQ